jgi:ABC-2 type transport system ATP-binding protein
VEAALDRVDLRERAADSFRSYSMGMKQRLGVAAALLGDPELLVLDEPTNGLDPAGMADMRRLVIDLAAHGQTVLLSSHLLSEVQEICGRVGVISAGRLLTESTVADLRGSSSLMVRATPTDVALATAMGIAGDDAVRLLDDGGLRLDIDPQHAPALTRALVGAGAAVHEIRPAERSLEEVFIEMTSGEIPASTTEEVVK